MLPPAPIASTPPAPQVVTRVVYVPAPPTTEAPRPARDWQAYEDAIRLAAVHGPQSSVPLRPIPPPIRRKSPSPPSPNGVLRRRRCSAILGCRSRPSFGRSADGKADPVLAIQQILGLPPAPVSRPDHQWQVVSFTVQRSEIFRPCPADTDVGADRCTAGSVAAGMDDATARFFAGRLLGLLQGGLRRAGRDQDQFGESRAIRLRAWDGATTGTPNPPTTSGISGCDVKPGAGIGDVTSTSPGTFCNGA